MRKRALCITFLDLNDRGAKMAAEETITRVLGVDKNADDAAIKKHTGYWRKNTIPT